MAMTAGSRSRDKGTRAEYQVRDRLREVSGLKWERVPGSGGFNASHGLKGDLYVPGKDYKYCVEVKHYKDDVINSNVLNSTVSQLEKFWQQTVREAGEIGKVPLLVFKKDRGKWIVATLQPVDTQKLLHLEVDGEMISLQLFEDWLLDKTQEDFLT